MSVGTLLVLGAAGYVGYQLLKPAAPSGPGPFGNVQPGTYVPPPAERTPVIRGSRLLEGVAMQRDPDAPQLVVQLTKPGGQLVVTCWATVRNGIWHERHAGEGAFGATEERHSGLNACGFIRWRGGARRGQSVPVQQPWVGVSGCPADGSGAPMGNRLTWLATDARVDLADRFNLTLWNAGDRYRGNAYDLRMEWAWTPPA